jgi:hypothetical protein
LRNCAAIALCDPWPDIRLTNPTDMVEDVVWWFGLLARGSVLVI